MRVGLDRIWGYVYNASFTHRSENSIFPKLGLHALAIAYLFKRTPSTREQQVPTGTWSTCDCDQVCRFLLSTICGRRRGSQVWKNFTYCAVEDVSQCQVKVKDEEGKEVTCGEKMAKTFPICETV